MSCGSTGEFENLTREQRRNVVDAVEDGTVIAGCGDTSPGTVRLLLEDATEAGADAAAIISYYSSMRQEALCEFFESNADKSQLPILIYNNLTTSQGISVELVAWLADHEGIVGIKSSSGPPCTSTKW